MARRLCALCRRTRKTQTHQRRRRHYTLGPAPISANMSIQMSLVFAALMVEMAVLFLFVLPLPQVLRLRFVEVANFLQGLTNFKIGQYFATILLLMQFVDCWQRLRKFEYMTNPYYTAGHQQPVPGFRGLLSSEQLASKFYSQRNLYITGAVLYMELAINTVLSILRKMVAKEQEYRQLSRAEQDTLSRADVSEAEKLRQLIAAKELDIETLRKQVQGLQLSYDALSDTTVRAKDE